MFQLKPTVMSKAIAQALGGGSMPSTINPSGLPDVRYNKDGTQRRTPPRFARKGEKFIGIAKDFLAAFPIGSVLTLDAFDAWGADKLTPEGERYFSGIAGAPGTARRTHHNSERRILREHVNLGGGADAIPYGERFCLMVDNSTGEYHVLAVEDLFLEEGRQLAMRTKNWFVNQANKIDRLIHSSDFQHMDLVSQFEAEQTAMRLIDFSENFDMMIRQCDRSMKLLRDQAKRQVARLEQQGVALNGGFTALLEHSQED